MSSLWWHLVWFRYCTWLCFYLYDYLFPHSFKNLNLRFTYYSSITTWCVLIGTVSVAVNRRLCIYFGMGHLCPLWLFSYSLGRGCPTATMTHWVFINKSICVLVLITISVIFHRDHYDYCWDVCIHGYSFWTTDLGFLKLSNFGSTIVYVQGYFCHRTLL